MSYTFIFVHIFYVKLTALATGNATKKKKKTILHFQTLLYLFYQPILQLTLEHSQQWCYIGILLYFSSLNTKIILQQWS